MRNSLLDQPYSKKQVIPASNRNPAAGRLGRKKESTFTGFSRGTEKSQLLGDTVGITNYMQEPDIV